MTDTTFTGGIDMALERRQDTGEARAAALLDGVRGAAPLVGAFSTGPEARDPIGRE